MLTLGLASALLRSASTVIFHSGFKFFLVGTSILKYVNTPFFYGLAVLNIITTSSNKPFVPVEMENFVATLFVNVVYKIHPNLNDIANVKGVVAYISHCNTPSYVLAFTIFRLDRRKSIL